MPLVLLKLADTVLILIKMVPSNVKPFGWWLCLLAREAKIPTRFILQCPHKQTNKQILYNMINTASRTFLSYSKVNSSYFPWYL